MVDFKARQRVVLFHGTAGHPCIHWLPWLRDALEERGFEVVTPWFPTPEGQHLDTWFSVLEEDIGELQSSDILVGHSAGACFILKVLERTRVTVAAAHLVAGFHELLPDPELNTLIRSFVFGGFDWSKIQDSCRKICLYHGDDDPYVPFEMAKEIARKLNTALEVIEGGQHLNSDSGFSEFPYLLDCIIMK